MVGERPQWSIRLSEWRKNNPVEAEALEKYITNGTIIDYEKGRVKSIDGLAPARRAVLYHITKLEEFNFPEYENPIDLKLDDVLTREVPGVAFDIWLGFRGITRNELAKAANTSSDSVKKFMDGQLKSSGRSAKIYENIIRSLKKYEKSNYSHIIEHPEKMISTGVEPRSRPELDDIARNIESIKGQLSAIGINYNPNLEDRINIVRAAIDSLYKQAEYFAHASESERTRLADSIDPGTWGLIINLYNNIHLPGNNPQTFARNFIQKNRRKQ